MRYRISAHQHSQESWEAQYFNIEQVSSPGYGIVNNATPIRLNKNFRTKKEADDCALVTLKEEGVEDKDIVIR